MILHAILLVILFVLVFVSLYYWYLGMLGYALITAVVGLILAIYGDKSLVW